MAAVTARSIRSCRCGSTRRWSTRRLRPTTPGSSRCPATNEHGTTKRRCRSGGRSAFPPRTCSPPERFAAGHPRTISEMQTATAIDALLADARSELPDLRLLTDVADRESYRLDETAYLDAGLPGAVALPASTAEVAALLRLAS